MGPPRPFAPLCLLLAALVVVMPMAAAARPGPRRAATEQEGKADAKGPAAHGRRSERAPKAPASHEPKASASPERPAEPESKARGKAVASHERTSEREGKVGGRQASSHERAAERAGCPPGQRATQEDRAPAHRGRGEPGVRDKKAERKSKKDQGKSLGAPNRGKLEGGVQLQNSQNLHRTSPSRAFGLPQLVRAMEHAAAAVVRKHKGPRMLVGDLSMRKGGFLGAHKSHQSGRDVDIAFYAVNSRGKPVTLNRFVPFDGSGRARDGSRLQFDDARNWTMMEDLLESSEVTVRYLFITSELRERLLAHAARKRVSRELYGRAAAALMSPDDADPHENHFHLRISCPGGPKGSCVEESVQLGAGREGAAATGSGEIYELDGSEQPAPDAVVPDAVAPDAGMAPSPGPDPAPAGVEPASAPAPGTQDPAASTLDAR
jgi:penicillin-insensitive murein endopeptidase